VERDCTCRNNVTLSAARLHHASVNEVVIYEIYPTPQPVTVTNDVINNARQSLTAFEHLSKFLPRNAMLAWYMP